VPRIGTTAIARVAHAYTTKSSMLPVSHSSPFLRPLASATSDYAHVLVVYLPNGVSLPAIIFVSAPLGLHGDGHSVRLA
jgi:hypothetical protein